MPTRHPNHPTLAYQVVSRYRTRNRVVHFATQQAEVDRFLRDTNLAAYDINIIASRSSNIVFAMSADDWVRGPDDRRER